MILKPFNSTAEKCATSAYFYNPADTPIISSKDTGKSVYIWIEGVLGH